METISCYSISTSCRKGHKCFNEQTELLEFFEIRHISRLKELYHLSYRIKQKDKPVCLQNSLMPFSNVSVDLSFPLTCQYVKSHWHMLSGCSEIFTDTISLWMSVRDTVTLKGDFSLRKIQSLPAGIEHRPSMVRRSRLPFHHQRPH